LLEPIGAGAFANVWVAEQDGKLVAVKIFHSEKLAEATMLWRFRRGIRVIQYLTVRENPDSRFIPIFQVDDTSLAFSMPYARRGNLEDIASRQWSTDTKIGVMLKLCRALEFAHGVGVVHRDIKPSNIVIDEHGEPRLTDFDIADILHLLTETYVASGLGTPAFAAPEQLDSCRAADFRSDIYSLGRLLHYLLCEKPLGIRSKEHLDFKELSEFPEALISIVRQATEHDPAHRYQTVKAFRLALEQWTTQKSGLEALFARVVRPVRHNGASAVLASIAVLSVITLIAREISRPPEKEPIDPDPSVNEIVTREYIKTREDQLPGLWREFLHAKDKNEEDEVRARAEKAYKEIEEAQESRGLPHLNGHKRPFRYVKAMRQMQAPLAEARHCPSLKGENYSGSVVVTFLFSHRGVGGDAKVKTEVPDRHLMSEFGAKNCIEDAMKHIESDELDDPLQGIPVEKTIQIKLGD